MPHPAFKWGSETCPVLLPVVSWQLVHASGCLPACGHTAGLAGHPACSSAEQPSATPGGCAHTGVGPRTRRSCRKASQPFPEYVGCQGPSGRSKAEGAWEFRRMCLLFDFSVTCSGLWLNPVCKVLSLLRELGATCAWRQAGENPQHVPVSPGQAALCPSCLAVLCSGAGDRPRSPRACGPSKSLCTLGNRPTAGAEPIPT